MAEPMPRRRLVIKHGALGDIIQGLDGYASSARATRKITLPC